LREQSVWAGKVSRIKIAKFLLARSKFHYCNVIAPKSSANTLQDDAQPLQSRNFQILTRDYAAELCLCLRNVAAIFGGAAKKFSCKEQASQQAVLPWLGRTTKGATQCGH